jgi:hypothetical protein
MGFLSMSGAAARLFHALPQDDELKIMDVA